MNNDGSLNSDDLSFPLEPTEQVEFEIQAPKISPNLFNSLQKPAVLQLSIEEFLQVTLGGHEDEKRSEV